MSLIAMKFIAAGGIAAGLLFLSLALGAGWDVCRRRKVKAPNKNRRWRAP
jgi:hypothetical protein